MHYSFNNAFRIALIYAYSFYFEYFFVQKANFDHIAVILYVSNYDFLYQKSSCCFWKDLTEEICILKSTRLLKHLVFEVAVQENCRRCILSTILLLLKSIHKSSKAFHLLFSFSQKMSLSLIRNLNTKQILKQSTLLRTQSFSTSPAQAAKPNIKYDSIT